MITELFAFLVGLLLPVSFIGGGIMVLYGQQLKQKELSKKSCCSHKEDK